VDISDKAIELGKKLSTELEIPVAFVCCNVLETSQHVNEQFDIVFTSYGSIGWLPDLKPWTQIIAQRLQPGGVFYMVEFHPILWMFDYSEEKPTLKYHYSQNEAIYDEYPGTYADPNSKMISKEYGWNHSLSEVIQSLLEAGLTLELFAEHEGSPYDVFPDMELNDDGLYYTKDGLSPSLFELKARKGN
jgi:SAM-dependent methyltransferase